MSIVVAVAKGGETVLASDSMSVFGSHREDETNIINNRKIISVGDSYLGYTGWGLYGNILHHYLKGLKTPPRLADDVSIFSFFLKFMKDLRDRYNLVNDQANSEKDPFADLDSSFVIANRNGIFGVSSNLSVCHYRTFHAIGSGCDYAFGAMHATYGSRFSAEEIARTAVEAAIHFDADCGGALVLEKVNPRRKPAAKKIVKTTKTRTVSRRTGARK